MDVECSDFGIRGFFSKVAGRPKAERTTTEAVKKELPPLCKATERFDKAAEVSDDYKIMHNHLMKNYLLIVG